MNLRYLHSPFAWPLRRGETSLSARRKEASGGDYYSERPCTCVRSESVSQHPAGSCLVGSLRPDRKKASRSVRRLKRLRTRSAKNDSAKEQQVETSESNKSRKHGDDDDGAAKSTGSGESPLGASARGSEEGGWEGRSEVFLGTLGLQAQRTYGDLSSKWGETPDRYKIIIAMALAFVVCNMDKVNISIAIIPMASDYGWKPTTAGFIQSAFFYGYLLAQLPGGWLANKYGGQKVLPFGVALWSLATAAVPLIAGDIGALSVSRAFVGLGEGISPPAAADVIARYVPVNERSRATSLVFGGLNMGTIAGLTIAPSLIESLGWPSVFVLFGVVGGVWCLWFDAVVPQNVRDLEGEKKALAAEQMAEGSSVEHQNSEEEEDDGEEESIPWLQFVQHKPLQALTYIHFCNNWAIYTILSWLPTFYKDSLNVGLQGAAHLALLPPVAGLAVSVVAAPLADGLIERGVNITLVRKLMQSIAFLSPAACMLACILSEDKELSTWLLPLGLGLQTFSFAGLYSNHQDISPKYASILLAITNIFGSMPGVVGVPFTGWLLDQTDSWTISLFVPCLFFYVSGAVIFAAYGSGERLVLEEEDIDNLVQEN